MKKKLLTFAILSLMIFASVPSVFAGDKVIMCHIPPGNSDNAHTIEVSENAVQAHLNHGDIEGECGGQHVDGAVEILEDLFFTLYTFRECTTDDTCLGDANNDNVIDEADLTIFINLFFVIDNTTPINSPDINQDGVLDVNDAIIITESFGPCDGPCPADIDNDGFVSLTDFRIFLTVADNQ